MVHHYYRNVHAVVFVYDVTNLASFEVRSQNQIEVVTLMSSGKQVELDRISNGET